MHDTPAASPDPSDVAPDAHRFCAEKLKVLADPTRLAIVRILMDGPQHVGGVNASLQIDQSLLSHHLRVLRDADMVAATRDGKAVRYALAPELRAASRGDGIHLGCCVLSFE